MLSTCVLVGNVLVSLCKRSGGSPELKEEWFSLKFEDYVHKV